MHDRDGRLLYFIYELSLQTLQSHITTQRTPLSNITFKPSGIHFSTEDPIFIGKGRRGRAYEDRESRHSPDPVTWPQRSGRRARSGVARIR